MSDDVQKLILGGSAILLGIAGFLAGGGEPKDLDPIGLSPSSDLCRGWKDTSEEVDHAIILKCERGDWIVYLRQGGEFSHALQKNTPGAQFIFDERSVPGWSPASSSPPP